MSGEGERDRQPSCRKEIDPEKQGVYTGTSSPNASLATGNLPWKESPSTTTLTEASQTVRWRFSATATSSDVIENLKTPASEEALRRFLNLLEGEPKDLIHPGPFGDLGLDIEDYNTPDALVGLLRAHPEVMNRPVCVRGHRAVIARPAEKVSEILD